MSAPENFLSKVSTVADSVELEAPVRLYGVVDVRHNSKIGKYSYLHTRSTVYEDSTIGRFCSIGKMVAIGPPAQPIDWLSSSPFQYDREYLPEATGAVRQANLSERPGVTVGNDVWIGTRVIIKRGVTVGDGAIIGANAIVTDDVPPYAIVVGSPAKVLKHRFDDRTIERLLETQWWDMTTEQLSNITFNKIDVALDQLEDASLTKQERAQEKRTGILAANRLFS